MIKDIIQAIAETIVANREFIYGLVSATLIAFFKRRSDLKAMRENKDPDKDTDSKAQ